MFHFNDEDRNPVNQIDWTPGAATVVSAEFLAALSVVTRLSKEDQLMLREWMSKLDLK